ncbi:MAG: hypothetical protein RLZZ306_1937 [Bacteroidota bacterium]|jgi:hypothetical protein
MVIIVIAMLLSRITFAGENEKNLYNSLLFNGKPLVYDQFSLSSRGVLTMVMGDSKTKETKTMLFKVYLKRQDKILPFGVSNQGNGVTELDVSEILKFANLGDQLVIEPIEKKAQMSTRVIFLRYSYFLEFLNRSGNKDGC